MTDETKERLIDAVYVLTAAAVLNAFAIVMSPRVLRFELRMLPKAVTRAMVKAEILPPRWWLTHDRVRRRGDIHERAAD